MLSSLAPGVYLRPRRTGEADVRRVRTDVAGFAGFAERGPLPFEGEYRKPEELAIRLTSFEEFRARFGGFIRNGHLAYAVRGFFENGGRTCYVVRVAVTRGDESRRATLARWSQAGAMVIEAASAGNWGNRIRLAVTPLTNGEAVTEFALRVTLEPGPDTSQPREEELYRRLSLDGRSLSFAPVIVNRRSRLVRLPFPEESGEGIGPASTPLDAKTLLRGPFRLEGGQDGLAGVSTDDFVGRTDDLRGLRLLEEIDEVSILCAPDAVLEPAQGPLVLPTVPPAPCAPPRAELPPAPEPDDPTAATPTLERDRIHQALIDQCERLRDRVAILDVPGDARDNSQRLGWREGFKTRFAAAYCPWLEVPDPLRTEGGHRPVPPSGHVAGVYARIDNLSGVHHPPANAAIEGVVDVAAEISSQQQEELNPRGLNALRPFPGRGIRVWGARSLAADGDVDWRFIHARRLMSMIEESVDVSTQWAVFEPNDDRLRRTLAHSISVFLRAIWQRGGLKGNTPAEGFFVKCDETNNPPAVVEAGQLVCQVGVAVAAPMEFLVFEVRQKPEGVEVAEL